jgi:hypothetical protein
MLRNSDRHPAETPIGNTEIRRQHEGGFEDVIFNVDFDIASRSRLDPLVESFGSAGPFFN